MELQSGLLSWQVEKLTRCSHPAGHSVSVRMGPFFRLTLGVHEGRTMSAALELTQPGDCSIIAAMCPQCRNVLGDPIIWPVAYTLSAIASHRPSCNLEGASRQRSLMWCSVP